MDIHKEVDARGLTCPLPILRAKKALSDMQSGEVLKVLATEGLEFGVTPGLDWISGQVRRLEPNDPALTIPHMGWNAINFVRPHALFAGIEDGAHMYYANSFALAASHPEDVVATTDHGGPFVAAVAKGNVAGVQFHPEKSQSAGLALLANFLEWRP